MSSFEKRIKNKNKIVQQIKSEICKKREVLDFAIIYNIYNHIGNVILLSYFNNSHYKIVKILGDNFGYSATMPNEEHLQIKLFELMDDFINCHVDDYVTYAELSTIYKRTRNIIMESILNSNILNTVIYEDYSNNDSCSHKNIRERVICELNNRGIVNNDK